MIALRVTFIAGRFHATPWDRAVNEGEIEWPPSPWRILRAIVSGWFAAQSFDRAALARLCDRLAEPPRFILPPTKHAHTRHYMPLGTAKNGIPDKTLILDSFVVFDGAEKATAYIVWDHVDLDEAMRNNLERAVGHISYLGRAESWCNVSVVSHVPESAALICVDLASRTEVQGPTVQRLCASAGLRGNGLLRQLFETTGEMRKARRRLPEHTQFVDYRFPADFGAGPRLRLEPSRGAPSLPRIERFVLEGVRPAGLRPSVLDTVRIAGLMRGAAMKRYSAMHAQTPAPTILTGRADGAPATGHGHAYFLPTDLDRDGRIDHIDVWLPAGASRDVLRALHDVANLWSYAPDAKYAVTYLGAVEAFRSKRWMSVTPFVPPRHMRATSLRGNDEVQRAWVRDQVVLELGHHRLPVPEAVEVWQQRPPMLTHVGGNRTRFDEFVQEHRPGHGQRARSYGATIVFADELTGPIAIGKEAHYGLGQFAAEIA